MWFCLRAGLPVLFGFEYNNNTFKKQYKKINIYIYECFANFLKYTKWSKGCCCNYVFNKNCKNA